ncbi:ABC transporter ATP-binding protein [Salinicoccus hispanicus]|uniref:ATP-binding cassette domain-containing protein n=1 Tax=Salinicoccus hispanicus TaxID=157225 RepID=A0A6N8U2U2_9STAP|nr:ATP-binding cassette domain-containing protein [Salinicoccus hispanicus]MXQ52082.1 ATP-binding cassette domain-containing protein [Salinicoccus hispanicus]
MPLEIKDLTISYGNHVVLESINFSIPDGNIIGLVAPNGTGKTTLFNAIIRFIPINKGEIRVDGQAYKNTTKDVRALHEKITFFPDQAELYENFSGYEHIEMYRDIWKGGKGDIDAIVDRLNMAGYVGDKVNSYSLGMRQRLCFAMMMAADTKIMFMDEIMNGLDPVNVELVSRILQEVKQEGKIIIVASHLLENLDDYADQIYFLNNKDIYYTYDRKDAQENFIKGNIGPEHYQSIDTLPEGTLYLNRQRICIPTKTLTDADKLKLMNRLQEGGSESVTIGPLGTYEHYLRIYKGVES